MKTNELANYFDHTALAPTLTKDLVNQLIKEAKEYKFASICIPPSWVDYASDKADHLIKICSVVGFPLGYQEKKTKVNEAKELSQKIHEIDMVINLSDLACGKYHKIRDEIQEIKETVGGKVLKVIVETAYHNEESLKRIIEILNDTDADFIKTSTGFAPTGASLEDIKFIKPRLRTGLKMKASGGIKTLDQALAFIDLGVERIGASSSYQIIKQFEKTLQSPNKL